MNMNDLQDFECPRAIGGILRDQKNFRSLSRGAISLLTETAVPCRLDAGQPLWGPGESDRFCAVIERGWIEIQSPAPGASPAHTGLYGPGDVVGLAMLFRPGAAEGIPVAIEDGTVVIKLLVRPLIEEWDDSRAAELANWIRSMFLLHEKILQDKIEVLAESSVDRRLFVFVGQLLRRFGRETRAGEAVIPAPLSKSQVARLVDIRVETSIRAINRWRELGLVRWEPNRVVIPSLPALRAAVGPARAGAAAAKGRAS